MLIQLMVSATGTRFAGGSSASKTVEQFLTNVRATALALLTQSCSFLKGAKICAVPWFPGAVRAAERLQNP